MKDGQPKYKKWFKKIGIAGIVFFTVKGIITLILIIGAANYISCGS